MVEGHTEKGKFHPHTHHTKKVNSSSIKSHSIPTNNESQSKFLITISKQSQQKNIKKQKSDQQTFDDFWQVMGERGGAFEVLSEIGMSANEAVKGTPDQGTDMDYWHIPPLVVNKKAQEKIIEKYGGIKGMKEFMAYNADWKEYQKELEAET